MGELIRLDHLSIDDTMTADQARAIAAALAEAADVAERDSALAVPAIAAAVTS